MIRIVVLLLCLLASAGQVLAQHPQCLTPYRGAAQVTYLPQILPACQPGPCGPAGSWQCPPGACPGVASPCPGCAAGTPYQPIYQPPARLAPGVYPGTCPGGMCPIR